MRAWSLPVFLILAACSAPSGEVAFTIPEADLIPEGIAFDSVDGSFYVGSTYKRKVVRIDSDGGIQDFVEPAADGLWGVVGMEVDARRRVLWLASSHAGAGMPMQDMDPSMQGSAGIFKYDLTTGNLLRKYILAGDDERHFFNDLTVTHDGSVYVTDSAARAIYRISAAADTLALFARPDGMPSPNGITRDPNDNYLFVALRGQIGRIDLNQGTLRLVSLPSGVQAPADGLYFLDQSLITVWPGEENHGVTSYPLNASLDSILRVEPIQPQHPRYRQPTTGAIVGRDIYVVANSQLQVFSQMFEDGLESETERLDDPAIIRVPIGR